MAGIPEKGADLTSQGSSIHRTGKTPTNKDDNPASDAKTPYGLRAVHRTMTKMVTEASYLRYREYGLNPDMDGRPNNSITSWVLSGCEQQMIADQYRNLNANGDQASAPSRNHVPNTLTVDPSRPIDYPFLDGPLPISSSEAAYNAVQDGNTDYLFAKPGPETLPEMNVTPALRYACHTFYSFLSTKLKDRVDSLINQSLPFTEHECYCDPDFDAIYAREQAKIVIETVGHTVTVRSPPGLLMPTSMSQVLRMRDTTQKDAIKYIIGTCKNCGDIVGGCNPLINMKLFCPPANYAVWSCQQPTGTDLICGTELIRYFAYENHRVESNMHLSYKEICASALRAQGNGTVTNLVLNSPPMTTTSKLTPEQVAVIGKYCEEYDAGCDYTPGFCKACGEAVGPMNPAIDMKKVAPADYWDYVVKKQKQNPTICAKEFADGKADRDKRAKEYSAATGGPKPRVDDLRPYPSPNTPLSRYTFNSAFEVRDEEGRVYKLEAGEPEWARLPVKCIKIVMCFASQWTALQGSAGLEMSDPKGAPKKKNKKNKRVRRAKKSHEEVGSESVERQARVEAEVDRLISEIGKQGTNGIIGDMCMEMTKMMAAQKD